MKCSITALCCKYRCCNTANNLPPFTDFTRLTGDPVCSRNKDVIFSLSISHKHTHTLSVHVCDLTFTKRRPIYFQSYLLQLSWCKDALSSEAREECSSAISLSLSVLYLSPTVYLSVLLQKWLPLFCSLSLPPSLSL